MNPNERVEYVEVPDNGLPYDQRYQPSAQDMVEKYGGVIRDLTDTESMLLAYEWKLQGKRLNKTTQLVEDIVGLNKSMDEAKAIEFVDLIRSIVNQNTHFTNFNETIINNLQASSNYTINRWLMFQGEKVPLRYRGKISFEAMNMITESLYKSLGGTILDWTKGSFTVGEREGANQGKQPSMFMPWTWGKGRN